MGCEGDVMSSVPLSDGRIKRVLQTIFIAVARVFTALCWLVLLAYVVAVSWYLFQASRQDPHWQSNLIPLMGKAVLPGPLEQFSTDIWPSILIVCAAVLLFIGTAWATSALQHIQRRMVAVDAGDGPRILPDLWFDDVATSDPLEYSNVADRLSRLIKRSAGRAPFSMALESRWGIGKTTIMRMMEGRLREDPYFTLNGKMWKSFPVWFDPWKHRKSDTQKAFMSAVFADVPWRALRWYLGPVMRGRVFAQIANVVSFLRQRGGMGGVRLANKLDVSAPYRNNFEQDFSKFLKYWSGAEGGVQVLMVIFVDDLDRCAPSDIADVLESMKLFLQSKNCVFVFGLDPTVVAKGIEKHYDGVILDGLAYLQKMLQVEFPLLLPPQQLLMQLLVSGEEDAKLTTILDVVQLSDPNYRDSILKYTRGTPRQIKRLLSALAVGAVLYDPSEYMAIYELLLLQVYRTKWYERVLIIAQQGRLQEVLDPIYRELEAEGR